MTQKKALIMMASRWVFVAALCFMLTTPAVASFADEQNDPTNQPSFPVSASPAESPNGSALKVGSDIDYPDEPGIDIDFTKESLESKYDNPGDVAMAPKLLVPKKSSSRKKIFDVYQLQHNESKTKSNPITGPRMFVVQSVTARLDAVPVNIDAARISFKTPAQDFFDGATNGFLMLGSSAVAMGGFILARSKRKDNAQN